MYVSLRAHHKHSQYLLAASQIFGLSDEETAIVSNIARYHRARACRRRATCPTSRSIASDRLIVNKLAAILRVGQRARRRAPPEGSGRCSWCARDTAWMLEVDGAGDLTMEQLAATARADMFVGDVRRQLVIRPAECMT